MVQQYVMAVDPGFTGALALYDSETHNLSIEDMPTVTGGPQHKSKLDLPSLLTIVERMVTFADVCVVERVAAMPAQGVSSAFRFGYVAGAIDGIVTASAADLVKWTPAQWKLRAGLAPGGDRAARKTLARQRAAAVFPDHAALFARVKDDGRAEAALLAWSYAQWAVTQNAPPPELSRSTRLPGIAGLPMPDGLL